MARVTRVGHHLWHVSYRSKLTVNAAPRTWRQRMATRLRRWADRLDGRASYAVHLDCDPDMSPAEAHQAVQAGFEFAGGHIRNLTRSSAMEELMRVAHPELYDQEQP